MLTKGSILLNKELPENSSQLHLSCVQIISFEELAIQNKTIQFDIFIVTHSFYIMRFLTFKGTKEELDMYNSVSREYCYPPCHYVKFNFLIIYKLQLNHILQLHILSGSSVV